MDIKQLYQSELHQLKKSAVEFAHVHPMLAPLLHQAQTDPDVERLLEGTAFLTAGIRQKLEDDFPTIVQTLLQMVFPHFLRPIPSATIIQFQPKQNLAEPLTVQRGTFVDSVPVNGVVCRYETTLATEVLPLQISSAELIEQVIDGEDRLTEVRLEMLSLGPVLQQLEFNKLRFYISGDLANACELFYLITNRIKWIYVRDGKTGRRVRMMGRKLRSVGFEKDESLLRFPRNVLPSLRVVQEYFLFPQKFLFFELDLGDWKDRGNGLDFRISLLCSPASSHLPKVESHQFKLFATPAVNLFQASAEPIVVDHHRRESLVRLSDVDEASYQIFSLDKVSGYSAEMNRERDFRAYSSMGVQWKNDPVYSLIFRPSITGGKSDLFMSLAFSPEEPLVPNEILSIHMTCCNANFPKALQLGDVREPTSNTPELVSFKNIEKPTAFVPVPLQGDLLSMLLSHLAVNQLSYSDHENLKTLLSLYIFPGGSDKDKDLTNRRRVDGICGVEVKPEQRLFEKRMVNGQRLKVLLNRDHFSNLGDIYLFGSILDSFFSSVVNINSYIEFEIEDAQYGEKIQWPAKLGGAHLV